MITVTFYAPTKHARKIQDLVKLFDGYFDRNEFPQLGYTELNIDNTEFKISFDGDNCDERYRKFSIRTDIINQMYF